MRVDFYLLSVAEELARWQFACRLIAKAYARQCGMFVYIPEVATAEQFDKLLWTFNDISFIPHALGATSNVPVCIGDTDENTPSKDLLINLSHRTVPDYARYQRIAEIVTSDNEVKTLSRQRYSEYREQGAQLYVHNV